MDNEFESFPDEYYHLDKQKLLNQYGQLAGDISAAYNLAKDIEIPPSKTPIDHVFFLGMGGSAISGDLMHIYFDHLKISVPITVVRDYDIPHTMTEHSLVFAVSYSGNTEETISAYRQALRVTKKVIAVSSGGKLEEIAKVNRNTHIVVPKGYQPRTAAISYLFFPFLQLLERYKILAPQSAEVEAVIRGVTKPDFKTHAITISEKLHNKIPLIYASGKFYPLAYRFKTQINEHAKTHAFCHEYSEFNHNEILGYENLLAQHHVVVYRFDEDHRRIKKRMDIVRSLLSKQGVETTDIKLSGDHFLTKIYSTIILGDLVAYYLALRYQIDPSPVTMIESLKEQMGPFI
ncbi:MAG: bifunctional phosphoglucose/phosphomannose isomerase [Nanoarchaeota archaeon]|nr:bifunctional phosphoglucose/phosphomannose isomerase [Nanoarchaeota archaeon]